MTAGLLRLPARTPVLQDDAATFAAISQLFARYGIAHDEVDTDAMQDVFTAQAELSVSLAGPPFETHRGRDAIVTNFARIAATQNDQRRHAISNVEITSLGPTRVSARAYGLVSGADAQGLRLAAACVYAATAACGADGIWRFDRLWIGMDDYAGTAPGTEV